MAEFHSTLIRPTTNVQPMHPDVVGFYAMPIDANVQNTGDRIQTMVDQIGVPFVMADLLSQHRKEVFGRTAKEANSVSGDVYRDMSLRRLSFVHEALSELDNGGHRVIAMGDSLGVPAVQGMQLHAPEDLNFDAVLLRDGWNLGKPSGKASGIARYARYQAKNIARDLVSSPPREITEYGYKDREPEFEDETSRFQKINNASEAMRGPENRANAIILAKRAAIVGAGVLNLVLLRQGLSGKPAEMDQFVADAHTAYNNVNRELSSREARTTSRLIAEVVDGWYSDLLDPARGAHDVQSTLRML